VARGDEEALRRRVGSEGRRFARSLALVVSDGAKQYWLHWG
jgi:hypothetical protein